MKYEIHHYSSDNLEIFSFSNEISILQNNIELKTKLPLTFLDKISKYFRLTRRLFRTDKCNVFVINELELKLLIIRRGSVYTFSKEKGLKFNFKLRNCRNIMHIDLCRLPNGDLFFGEYGSNNDRKKVPIYGSFDGAENWKIVYEFPKNSIKHIHNVKYDKFTGTIWCCTGDNDGENNIIIFNKKFEIIKQLNDGSQLYRTCNLFFKKNFVYWLMDSPNDISYVIKYNRKTEEIMNIKNLAGPVWYSKEINDDMYLAATSVEPGYSMQHKTAELLFSSDLLNWKVIKKFKKDLFHIDFFKYGVIAFPNGNQNPEKITYFGEALKTIDGEIKEINLNEI